MSDGHLLPWIDSPFGSCFSSSPKWLETNQINTNPIKSCYDGAILACNPTKPLNLEQALAHVLLSQL